MSNPTIGWIGLGHMGVPMAANLKKAGFPLKVWNRTPSRMGPFGPAAVENAAALAQAVDMVITMVADDAAEEEALFGPNGAARGLRAGQTVINMGTVSPEKSLSVAKRLGELGVDVLDAPVSGSVKPATDGTLIILVGGEERVLESCRPIFDVLGRRTFYFGGHGKGSMAKLAINMMLGMILEALAESVSFGESMGLDRNTLLDMIGETPCASPIVALKLPSLRADDYPAAFPLKHMAKDFRLALAAGGGLALPSTRASSERFDKAEQSGMGDLDIMAVIKTLAKPA